MIFPPNNSGKPYENIGKNAKNEQGRRCVNTVRPLTKNAPKQEAHMAANSQYGDSTPKSNSEWKSVGELARKLVEGSVE